MHRVVVICVALGACYSPDIRRCKVTCEDSDHCPGAQICGEDHFCHQPDDLERCDPDAEPPPIDAMSDAMPDALFDAGPDAEPPDAMPPDPVGEIAMGGDFACVIDQATKLYCWGYNRRGAIAHSSTVPRYTVPTEIGGTGWTAIDTGEEHVCGIRNSEVYCWGSDDSGESNDGSPNHLETPTKVPGSSTGWTDIATGGAYTCGIRDDGGGARHVYCWGANDEGQLARGVVGSSVGNLYLMAAADDGLHDDWKQVSAGANFACALRDGGEAYCWGDDAYAQIGDGTEGGDELAPKRVVASPDGGMQTFTRIAAGYVSACAIGSDGGLYCWGDNGYETLGNDPLVREASPRRVGSDTDWSSISVFYYHACGSRTDGVYCWGKGEEGQLGNGEWGYSASPSHVVGINTVSTVVTGYLETCAAPAAGGVYCWGENVEGELGIGETSTKHVPTQIMPATGWTAVRAGAYHTCGVNEGTVYCWGDNYDGQVTGVQGGDVRVPTAVPDVPTATEVAGGNWHSCALAADASGTRPWCWGYNSDGQIGFGGAGAHRTATELDVAPVGSWHHLVATGRATCMMDGTSRTCWGMGSGYGLGDSDISLHLTPTAIADGGLSWLDHTLGYQWGCGVQTGGALTCWGIDSYGTQGDDTPANATPVTPHVIDSGTSYTTVAGFENDHACAIQTDGDLSCWGRNDRGQLGADTGGSPRYVPTQVAGTGDWSAIATGYIHTCGVKDGQPYCWGSAASGQAGVDDDYYFLLITPTRAATTTGWTHITTGFYHSCGIRAGELYCWGANHHGAVGDGTGSYNTPQMVTIPPP